MARQKESTYITENKPFSKNLRGLMFDKKTSQTELAAFVKCTRQAISLYATGQSTPDIDILIKIADYFDVSTDYLLGLTTVKTSDVKIKDICEYTGLSENAVECIKKYNNFNNEENHHLKGCITALDKYLSSGSFWKVLINVNQYFNSVKELKEIQTNKINPNIGKQLKIQNVTKPLALFTIQKKIIELTEEIGKKIYSVIEEISKESE